MGSWTEFIRYYDNRVDPTLENIEAYYQYSQDDDKEYDTYKVLLAGEIRDYGLCYVIEDPENEDGLSFVPIDDVPKTAPSYIQKGEICRTPMINIACYTARMEAEKISQYYYEILTKVNDGWESFHDDIIYYILNEK